MYRKRFSVFLSNSHPITHGAWQYGPNVIEIGGVNVQEAKPLPANLQQYLDKARNGAVLVSFGSLLLPSQMEPEQLEMVLETFRSLSQYSFIWRCDIEIDNLPKNVLTSKWLPQQDILAHPNLRVFVTHGGIGSLSEVADHRRTIL